VNLQSKIVKGAHEIARNIKQLSSFDMDEQNMREYAKTINLFAPEYIYGYASSLYFFAKWLDDRGIKIHSPKGIFSTAEKLFPNMRTKIENVFGTSVYDTYGLNDGGVSAYECVEHSGLHIDTERAVMEVVDEGGSQLEKGEGKIIATSLYNYAMPLLRYNTGDWGNIIDDICACGRGHKLLKEIVGRQQEILKTPEGKYIHGEFFTHIFWEIDGVKEFQVIQKNLDQIIIKIVPEENFDEGQLSKIREIIKKRSEGWHIEFNLADKIERTSAGKYKFVIREFRE
jgi:phenylacetate-CoA ligase